MSEAHGGAGEVASPHARGEWRGPVNQILYCLLFTGDLDATVVDGIAQAMVARSYLIEGPAAYAEAISGALAFDGLLNEEIETPHSEEQIRSFLSRLAERLDALKPWPAG
jgi:hypothetical protein